MKFVMISLLFFCLSACQCLPEVAQSIEDIATDDAVVIKVDRDAIKKDTDVHILVDVINKSPNQ